MFIKYETPFCESWLSPQLWTSTNTPKSQCGKAEEEMMFNFLKETLLPKSINTRILKRHISMCLTVLACQMRAIRHRTPPFLAYPAISLSGENSVTWVEITLGNVILCTSLKRHPYQTTFILIKYWVKNSDGRTVKMALQRKDIWYI